MADSTSSAKTSEADIREDWVERTNGHNRRGRVSRAPNWRPLQAAKPC